MSLTHSRIMMNFWFCSHFSSEIDDSSWDMNCSQISSLCAWHLDWGMANSIQLIFNSRRIALCKRDKNKGLDSANRASKGAKDYEVRPDSRTVKNSSLT